MLSPVAETRHDGCMSDLRERVPGQSLIQELLRRWDLGRIRIDPTSGKLVIDDEAVSWYRGVLGERYVASILDTLGDGYTVLHSVPVGRGTTDIDHVVISDAGVFTINTKYSPGKDVWVAGRGVVVGGFKQPYVRNSLAEAHRAAESLSKISGLTVPVTALIVFVNPAKLTRKATAGGGEYEPDIQVISDRELKGSLSGRPVFSSEQISRIVSAAVEPSTWHSSPAESAPGSHFAKEFEALEAELGKRLDGPLKSAAAKNAKNAKQQSHTKTTWTAQQARGHGSRKRKKSLKDEFVRLIAAFAALAVGYWILTSYLASLGK
jgi:hypothetical protein